MVKLIKGDLFEAKEKYILHQDLFARNPTTLVVGGIAHSLTFLLDKQKSLVYISIYDKNSFY